MPPSVITYCSSIPQEEALVEISCLQEMNFIILLRLSLIPLFVEWVYWVGFSAFFSPEIPGNVKIKGHEADRKLQISRHEVWQQTDLFAYSVLPFFWLICFPAGVPLRLEKFVEPLIVYGVCLCTVCPVESSGQQQTELFQFFERAFYRAFAPKREMLLAPLIVRIVYPVSPVVETPLFLLVEFRPVMNLLQDDSHVQSGFFAPAFLILGNSNGDFGLKLQDGLAVPHAFHSSPTSTFRTDRRACLCVRAAVRSPLPGKSAASPGKYGTPDTPPNSRLGRVHGSLAAGEQECAAYQPRWLANSCHTPA